MIGVIRMIDEAKRFGFIKANDGDYFFHASAFNGHWDDLCADYRNNKKIEMEFDPEKGPKGLRANNVSRTDWPNQAAREFNG
jgi:cold shock CspA family protein